MPDDEMDEEMPLRPAASSRQPHQCHSKAIYASTCQTHTHIWVHLYTYMYVNAYKAIELATLSLLTHINRYLYGIFMGNLLTHTHARTRTLTVTPIHTSNRTAAKLIQRFLCTRAANRFEIACKRKKLNKGAHDTCASSLCGCTHRLSGTFSPHFFFFLAHWVVWVWR